MYPPCTLLVPKGDHSTNALQRYREKRSGEEGGRVKVEGIGSVARKESGRLGLSGCISAHN